MRVSEKGADMGANHEYTLPTNTGNQREGGLRGGGAPETWHPTGVGGV